MIDAKELRLNNIVLITEDFLDGKKGDYAVINAQSFMALHTFGGSIYSPVELSPSILEKFINDNNPHVYRIARNHYGISFGLFIDFSNGIPFIYKKNSVGMVCDICEVPHIHSLQNAFYALTQNELEIKL